MPNANDVYRTLKEAGIETHWPKQAVSPLKTKTCIVSHADEVIGFNTDIIADDYIEIEVCVPFSYYGDMDDFLEQVKDALRPVKGLRYNGASRAWSDDDMRASIRTIEYLVMKRTR